LQPCRRGGGLTGLPPRSASEESAMTASTRLIQGRVSDAAGRPLAGARISIVDSPVAMPDIALLTDAAGRFVLGAPAAGRYLIGIDADDAGRARQAITIGDDGCVLDIRLPA
jgi:hypothetical protein